MILRFGLSNCLSILDYQELSLAASNLKGDLRHLISVDNPSVGAMDFLPTIAFYGANAAGKSNFLFGMDAMRKAVSFSYAEATQKKRSPSDNRSPTGFRPCRLSAESAKKSTHLDIDLLIEGVRYHYGFEANSTGYIKEWLYAYPKKVRQVIFVRDFDDAEQPFEAGATLRSKIDATLRTLATDKSFLFLSAAGTVKHPVLEPIFDYFNRRLVFLQTIARANEQQLAEQLKDERIKAFVVKFLRAVDAGVVDIAVEEVEPSEKEQQAFASMLRAFGKAMQEIDPSAQLPIDSAPNNVSVKLVREGITGERFSLHLGMESSGTLHLLSILVPVLAALEEGHALIVDEITTSLHTMVSQEIIKLFANNEINKTGAQFIFSTHDTNLLSSDILRRDEIWFAEKDTDSKSHIYPLTDFKTRKVDNIEKGYLQGRFGGIPYFGDIGGLFGRT